MTRRELLKAASVLGASGGAATTSARVSRATASGWPTFRHDVANTGSAADERGPTADIEQRWRFQTGDLVRSSPAVADGTVYVGGADGNVYALAAEDGTEQWRFQTGDAVSSPPTVVDGTVYVGSDDDNVYALAVGDGTEQWRFQTGDAVRPSPAVVNGVVYVGSGDGNVYALSAEDGTEQWRFQTGGWVRSSPAVVDNTVYVGSNANSVHALAVGDGTERWRFQADDWVRSSPAVVDGTVYVGSDDGNVYALAAADGTEKWRFRTDEMVFSSPAVANGSVYIGHHNGSVYALAAADGTEQWRLQTGGSVGSSPAVVDGIVYVGTHDNEVYAVAAGDGTEQWRFQMGGLVGSSPAVADGAVFVGSDDGHVYALTSATASTDSPTPTPSDSPTPAGSSTPVSTVPNRTGHAGNRETPLPSDREGLGTWELLSGSVLGTLLLGGGIVWWRSGSGSDSPATGTAETTSGPTTSEQQPPKGYAGPPPAKTSDAGEPAQPVTRDSLKQRLADLQDRFESAATQATETPDTTRQHLQAVRDDLDDLRDDASTYGFDDFTETAERLEDALDAVAGTTDHLTTARSHRDTARQARDAGDYEAALAAYGDALDSYGEAVDAGDGTPVDVGALATERKTVADARDDTRTKRALHDRLAALRDQIADAEDSINDDPARARERFQTLAASLADLATEADEEGFVDIGETARGLVSVCEEHAATADRIATRPGPPDTIPSAPSLTVAYEDLDRGERVGRGGNADVYKVTTRTDGDTVTLAVKEPRFRGTLHGEVVERFREEAETWARLDDHDHVVDVVDWGAKPLPWIAMEYMDGGDLRTRIDEDTIDLREGLWTAQAVTEAVSHARDRGVSHLDLKPANVLFTTTPDDVWDVPKVGDWGLAQLLIEHSKSMEGLTVQYAAPEQVTDGDIGHHTDIYQLGAVFYELFVGTPPFTGTPATIVNQISNDQPTPPTEANPDLPAAMDDILLPALAKSPADRYDHPLYLRDSLQDLYEEL